MSTHVLDFEPMWSPPLHPVSTTVPVALAVAQARRLPGREVVAAVAKGMEFQGRLQFAANAYEPEALPFHPPGVAGLLGATVTAAHLLTLDVPRTQHALGIAGSRCGALLANAGTMTKAMHCGNAAAGGLEAALLAAQGFCANPDILEASKGLLASYYPTGLDEERLRAFGVPWRVADPGLAFKLYPSQYGTHFAIDAALQARRQLGAIERIRAVRMVSPRMRYVDRPHPRSGIEGKFSLQYAAAAALHDGKVTIDTFTDERLLSDGMQGLLARVELVQTDSIPGDWRRMRVDLELDQEGGPTVRVSSHGPPGCWGQRPLQAEEHLAKLLDCLGRQMDEARAARLLACLQGLHEANGEELLAILAQLERRAEPDRSIPNAMRHRRTAG